MYIISVVINKDHDYSNGTYVFCFGKSFPYMNNSTWPQFHSLIVNPLAYFCGSPNKGSAIHAKEALVDTLQLILHVDTVGNGALLANRVETRSLCQYVASRSI